MTITRIVRNRGIPVAVAGDLSTTFPATENPISEGGAWTVTDKRATPMRTTTNKCFGTQDGTGGPREEFNDSQATLSGYGPNVRIEGIVFVDGAIGALNHELELCFRTIESAGVDIDDPDNWTTKYECLFNKDGGCSIAKWLGPVGAGGGHGFNDFPGPQPDQGDFSYPTPVTGTKICAQIWDLSGSSCRIRMYSKQSGDPGYTLRFGWTDTGGFNQAAYMTGQPGLGSFINNVASNPAHYGFSHVEVYELATEDDAFRL